MRRWAFNIFCAVSLLVFAASIVLWVRSYFVGEDFNRKAWGGGHEVFMSIGLTPGALAFLRTAEYSTTSSPAGGWGWSYARYAPTAVQMERQLIGDRLNLHLAGLHVWHWVRPNAHGWVSVQQMILPLWLFLPAAIPPILWWRRHRRGKTRGFPVETQSPAPVS